MPLAYDFLTLEAAPDNFRLFISYWSICATPSGYIYVGKLSPVFESPSQISRFKDEVVAVVKLGEVVGIFTDLLHQDRLPCYPIENSIHFYTGVLLTPKGKS